VLETYGTGNAPDNRQDFLQALADANNRGVIIVNVTQCSKGLVDCNYATGKGKINLCEIIQYQALSDCGVISGNDLTTECALVKLS
jgi:lysophospholipase